MKRSIWMRFASLTVALALIGSARPATSDTQEFRDSMMLAKLLLKYREGKTMTQNVTGKMTVNADGVTVTAELQTTVHMAQPNRFRFESKITALGQEKHGLTISDGKTVWELDSDAKQYSKQPFQEIGKNEDAFTDWLTGRSGADMTPILFLAGASGKSLGLTSEAGKSIEVKDYPVKEIEGRKMYLIPVPINEKTVKGQATLYVDVEDMLVHRCRFQLTPPSEKNGPKNLSVEFVLNYDKIQVNDTLPDETFTFTPSEDVKKVKEVKSAFDRAFD